jgi:hypothetical protein
MASGRVDGGALVLRHPMGETRMIRAVLAARATAAFALCRSGSTPAYENLGRAP